MIRILLLYYPFWAFSAKASMPFATVSQRRWYEPRINSLISPWLLSLHFHQEQPGLHQAITSRNMPEEQTLAAVIIMFGSVLFLISFFKWHALKWSVGCLNVDLSVLYSARWLWGFLITTFPEIQWSGKSARSWSAQQEYFEGFNEMLAFWCNKYCG